MNSDYRLTDYYSPGMPPTYKEVLVKVVVDDGGPIL